MNKTSPTEAAPMAENQSHILNRSKLLHAKIVVFAALTVVILAAAPSMLKIQQGIIAQEQQQHSLSNQTVFDIGKPIEDLSFEIDNVTFSHHTASVNGIQNAVVGTEL